MNLNEEILIEVLMRHIPEITQWVNEVVINNVVDPVEMLPPRLRSQLRCPEAFRRAFNEGWITIESERMVSHFGSLRMLAHFCGRTFAGDTVVAIHKFRMVESGHFPFPASELERLFGVGNLREQRKNLLKNRLPKRYQVIDNLFDM